MRRTWDGPADTRMMGIVHDGLRRDLGRLRTALDTPPSAARRRAIAAHVGWLMDFLRDHHSSEDQGLYPLVRETNPTAAALLDAMAGDHAAVDPAVTGLRSAAARWGESGSAADRRALVGALDDLETVLLPHLDREEREAMPLVSTTLTHRQWHAWDQKFNIKPKSLAMLAEEGLWLLDDLDPERRTIVEAEVPWLPRQIILHGFGPGYRRRAAARWSSRSTETAS